MIHDLYADNYDERKLAALLRSGGRGAHTIDGKRCPRRLGTFKVSRAHNAGFERLHVHHVNDDPHNPDAELAVLCDSCHMKLHRQPGADGKVPPRKVGYNVISIRHLLMHLTSAGFHVEPSETCRVTWRIGALQGEAADALDAICMAMHWREPRKYVTCRRCWSKNAVLPTTGKHCQQHSSTETPPSSSHMHKWMGFALMAWRSTMTRHDLIGSVFRSWGHCHRAHLTFLIARNRK